MSTQSSLTAELRWFEDGPLPKPCFEWASQYTEFSETESRTDDYLLFSNSKNVGVKFREGNFEIKSLVEKGDIITAQQLKGQIEIWEKVSFDKGFVESTLKQLDLRETVHKERVKFILYQKENKWQPIQTIDNPDHGCQLEFTEITVRDQKYWTFNLEAFSDTQKSDEVLKNFVIALSGLDSFVRLLEDHFQNPVTASYPSYLMKIANR